MRRGNETLGEQFLGKTSRDERTMRHPKERRKMNKKPA